MRAMIGLSLVIVALAGLGARQIDHPFVGSWNLTGVAPDTSYVYWLEVKDANGQLTGMFLNRGGNPNPLAFVRVEGPELVFRGGQPANPSGPEYRARLEDGRLIGRHTLTTAGAAGAPPTDRVVNWIGVRQHVWRSSNANGAHTYGPPVTLFDGKSLDAFTPQNPARPLGWTITEGVAANEAGANNLISKDQFMNFKLEAEYRLGPKSNSGFYLRGRYELQVLDDFSDTTTRGDLSHMAIYGRTAPAVKASKPAGEWQTMTAIVAGNRVTVTLNGQRVHNNAEILGITGGALNANELTPGPLVIQGDHTGVWLRKVVITPITRLGP